MKKSILIVISFSLLLFFCFCSESKEHLLTFSWKANKAPLQILLVDSFVLPTDFPKHLMEVYKDHNQLAYTHNVVVGTGAVEGIKLSVLDLESGKISSILTGIDRTGQMRHINKLFVEDGTVYTIDPNKQIILYSMDLNQTEKLVIDCSEVKSFPDGDFFIKNNGCFLASLRSSSKQAEYNPIVKIDKNGKAQYINEDIKIDRIENQMRDYPFVLADVFKDEMIVLPQHHKYFFIINL